MDTFKEALTTVDCKQAGGKYHLLWIDFAKFYESQGQLKEADQVFERAVRAGYKTVDELANVWCEWTEMKLRHEYLIIHTYYKTQSHDDYIFL